MVSTLSNYRAIIFCNAPVNDFEANILCFIANIQPRQLLKEVQNLTSKLQFGTKERLSIKYRHKCASFAYLLHISFSRI